MMKTLINFMKTTMIGGLLIVLPIWVTVLLLLKAIKGALAMLRPIAMTLPQGVAHADLVALALLVLICFLVGLLVHIRSGQRLSSWMTLHFLNRIPGFSIVSGMARQLAGNVDEQSFHPALAEIEEALVPAFIVEKHPDGQFTVFVSSSPTPMAGAIYILPPERVHIVDVPLRKAMICVTKWGVGAQEWRAAMRPGSAEAKGEMNDNQQP